MSEKKVKRISVRVPASWKTKCKQNQILISEICRSAIWAAICKCEFTLPGAAKLRSKATAARLFNALSEHRVRTSTPENEAYLVRSPVKLGVFSEILKENASADDLISLGEFMNQGEYAEEVLSEVYDEISLKDRDKHPEIR